MRPSRRIIMTLFKVNYADFFICMAGGSHQVEEILLLGIFQASFMNSFVDAKTRQKNYQNAQNPGEVIFCKLYDPEEIVMKHLATSLDKKLIPPSGLFRHSHKYKFYWVYYIRCKLN